MAEAAKSSFDLLGLVKTGLTGGVKAVTISAGKWALGRSLNALFGFKTADQVLNDTLAKINSELAIIGRNVDEIQKITISIDVKVDKILTKMSTDSIKDAAKVIEGSMIDLCSKVKHADTEKKNCEVLSIYQTEFDPINLPGKPQSKPASPNSSISQKDLNSFAAQILNTTTGIFPQMQAIRSALLNEGDNSPGALAKITDYAIKSMDAGSGDLVSWYEYIEQNFIKWTTELLYGMVLIVNAKCMKDKVDGAAHSADDWLESVYEPMINNVVSEFLGCVERLVLSRYNPVTQSNTAMFLSNETLTEIFSRADLLAWQLLNNDENSKGPGIIVRRFLRPSQVILDKKQGPSLKPAEYQENRGVLIIIPKMYSGKNVDSLMPYWYKCVDFTDAPSNIKMQSFDGSDIRTVRYGWAWSSKLPVVGEALGKDAIFSKIAPHYYDKSTLKKTDTPTDNSVLFASYTEADSITENLVFTSSQAGWEPETYFSPDQDADILMPDPKPYWELSQTPRTASVQFEILKEKSFWNGKGPCTYILRIKRQVFYPGPKQRINYILFGSYTLNVENKKHRPNPSGTGTTIDYPYPPASVEIIAKVNKFASPAQNNHISDIPVQTFIENKRPYRNDKNKHEMKGIYPFELDSNYYASFQWRIQVKAERQDGNNKFYDGKTPAGGSIELNYFRLAWDQPKLTRS